MKELPETAGIESSTSNQRIMSIDALRGMDMFFIVGMEEVFEAISEMFPMSPTLNDRLQHAPWAGFHFYDLIFAG
jgi:predicted acyltransferase